MVPKSPPEILLFCIMQLHDSEKKHKNLERVSFFPENIPIPRDQKQRKEKHVID